MPRKALVLSAMLILTAHNRRATREEASAFLWPGANSSTRGASLRTLVRRVRAVSSGLPQLPLQIDDLAIAVVTGACRCDLIELRALLSQGDPEAMGVAAALMGEPLLEGCEAGGGAPRAWILARRESLALEFARQATRALKSPRLLGNPGLREALEQKILDVRPIDARAQAALAKIVGGRARVKAQPDAEPPRASVGQIVLPLPRED